MESRQLAKRVAGYMLEKKAADIVIMDMRELTSITDFFVICSVDSEVQARAVMDHLNESLRGDSVRPWHVEGGGSNWLLLDFVDVVAHIFKPETRRFYALERLWGDAVFHEVTDTQ